MDKDNFLTKNAMDILLYAGQGRIKVLNALDEVENFNFENAENILNDAKEDLIQAHKAQTNVIQSITSGKHKEEYSMLFSHAQDTVMTIYSEYNIANKLTKILKKLIKEEE